MEQFMDLLPSYGLDKMVQFDISVVRGLSYYTGIVFEAFDANKKSRAIFGGGRYDNLLGDIGGTPATAVGLGFGDVVIADVLSETGKAPAANRGGCMTIGYMTEDQRKPATVLATALRRKGKPVDVALRPEKAKHFFSRAGNMHFSEAVYLGPDDIAKGTIRIKDLASRQESELPISQVTQD
jgi:histidyl-tRNA synthetase